MSFRSNQQASARRYRNDVYEECLTRAYIDAMDAGVDVPWNGRITHEEWPDTIQPYLEQHMDEAVERGWFDRGHELRRFQRERACPWHDRRMALFARRAFGDALIRLRKRGV